MNYRSHIYGLVALACLSVGLTASNGISNQANAAINQTEKNAVINNNKNSLLVAQSTDENELFWGQFQNCSRSGKNVICGVTFKGKQDINNFDVYCNNSNSRKARLFDTIGNVYDCAQVQMGGSKGTK